MARGVEGSVLGEEGAVVDIELDTFHLPSSALFLLHSNSNLHTDHVIIKSEPGSCSEGHNVLEHT